MRLNGAVWLRQIMLSMSMLTFFVVSVAVNAGLATVSSENSQQLPAAPSDFTQEVRLISGSVSDSYANIGVGISGNTAIVASAAGAYVYVRSGTTWSQQALLIPSDGLSGFEFPRALALEGDTAIIGCTRATINGNSNQGAAYVFVRNGTTWTEQQRLTASDAASNDNFGRSISISGESVIISAPTHTVGANAEQGAAYVFVRSNSVWTEQARILAEDGNALNNFGLTVALDGNTAVVSRARRTTASIPDPAVYVFVRNGTTWQQQQRLSLCEPSSLNLCSFGNSLAVKGDTLAIGNLFLNVGPNDAQGGVYIFTRSGTIWSQQQKLTAADGLHNDYFGSSLGISSQTLVVGASADLGVPGKAYIHNWSGSQWVFQQKLQPAANRNAFGQFLSIDGNSLIVAAPTDAGSPGAFIGAAYVFVSGPPPTPTPTPTPPAIQFSLPLLSVDEGTNGVAVTITRTGNLAGASTVEYATSDAAAAQNCNVTNGLASSRCDYITTLGSLHFVAGETSKTILVPIIDDSRAEGTETFTITLTNATGATLGTPSVATLSITDNEIVNETSNPIDNAGFFVRQHYIDFLNREPDSGGLGFWTNEITQCGTDPACVEIKRINVSAAFFISIEFQNTGYLVERFYKVSYGDANGTSTLGGTHQLSVPIVRFNDFLRDTQEIGQGVIVGQTGWEQALENNKIAFASEFVQRVRFTTTFPSTMTAAQFVDTLNTNARDVNGVKPLSQAERDALVNDLTTGAKTRAQVLRAVAEHTNLYNAEYNRAFVLMQYFGYLRRNPDDPQDMDYTGYDFWLRKLNEFNGNFINAEMVKAFITSIEYRQRFSP